MASLKFGGFMAPFHRPGENPTLALQRDLDLAVHMDRLGYDELWFGEHHSAGSELIASPEILIAAAAERTKRIKFGTGVTSVSYHNPLWVADRMVFLDHLTRGRSMLGMGPGSLPSDSKMIGLSPTDTRELMDDNVEIITRLLAGEVVTKQTKTHNLVDARLQLRPFTEPCFDIAVAAVASPTGPRLAGRFGLGLLSIGATLSKEAFNALALHWDVMCERAAHYGQPAPDRSKWRLVGIMHVAETEAQARRDVEYGVEPWFHYFEKVAAFPQMGVQSDGTRKNMIDFVRDAHIGVIGTPDQACDYVQRLVDQSGGFGTLLLLNHDWANPEATRRSLELIAQNVLPNFQGSGRTHAQSTLDAAERAGRHHAAYAQEQTQAVAHMSEKYAREQAGD